MATSGSRTATPYGGQPSPSRACACAAPESYFGTVLIGRSLRSLPIGASLHGHTWPYIRETPPPRGNERNIGTLLRLPWVPSLRLADGRQAELATRIPVAPMATELPELEVCRHLGTLYREARWLLDGAEDQRAVSLTRGHGGLRKVAVDFWTACREHKVVPASWLAWSLAWWRETKSGQPPVRLMLSADRVRKGPTRRMYRLRGPRLGGDVVYDPVGAELLHRYAGLSRLLGQLVACTAGHATDEQVQAVVLHVFPKGAANAAKLLEEVHTRCSQANAGLRGAATMGRYIWVPGAQ